MNITDEAVEAVERHLQFYMDQPGVDWTVEARAILEAAAPFMTMEGEWSAEVQGLTRVNPFGILP